MKQVKIDPRPHWKDLAKDYGFDFYQTIDPAINCWKEDTYYEFTLKQVEEIEEATQTLHQMCVNLTYEVAANSALMAKLGIPEFMFKRIKEDRDKRVIPWHLYGRFDFAYDGFQHPKLLEYNADTPTALFESAVWQWVWLEEGIKSHDLPSDADQFNSIHDKLKERWKVICSPYEAIHFTCMGEFEEDRGTVRYLEDTAHQSGYKTQFISIEDIGTKDHHLYDLDNNIIRNIFKLYPWEWLTSDDAAKQLVDVNVRWIEPVWKMILSNKGLLPLLWERYPNHPNLLPAFFEDDPNCSLSTNFVRKPLLSREGSNITLVKDGETLEATTGVYDKGPYIRQATANIPYFGRDEDKRYIVIGSWVVGNDPAGMILRESREFITNNISQLVPHIIKG